MPLFHFFDMLMLLLLLLILVMVMLLLLLLILFQLLLLVISLFLPSFLPDFVSPSCVMTFLLLVWLRCYHIGFHIIIWII